MAAVSVFESHQASTLGIIVDEPGEVEAIRLFRAMSPAQQEAWLVLARSIVRGSRPAPWHGHKPGRA